jgi:transcriptional regulator with XRE-family HTH domain
MVMTVDRRGQRDYAKQTGTLLRQYRERLGLTQYEAEKLSGVRREYIGSIETGRIAVIYPEPFNALHKAYGFPGWEILESMGYETDVDKTSGYNREVLKAAALLASMPPEDRALVDGLIDTLRKKRVAAAG